MRLSPHLRLVALTLVAALAALSGCSSTPTAPVESVAGPTSWSNPEFIRVPVLPAPEVGLSNSSPGGARSSSRTIDGSEGGVVERDDFRVEVPAGAWPGSGTVTLTIPDRSELRCELHVTGVPNAFLAPVKLIVDWKDAREANEAFDPEDLRLVWFDDTTGLWVLIPYEIDYTNEVAWAYLQHFSDYGLISGKAGW